MIGIYRIRNIINNNCYYGSSKNINKRWKRHKWELKNKKHQCDVFYFLII
jgi:predicted GIY-YIG superfamily endonuclease